MGYARHVGRVGVLAVALGIGGAIATTPGVAWPQTESNSGTSSSAESGSPGSQAGAPNPSTQTDSGTQSGPQAGTEPDVDDPANTEPNSSTDVPNGSSDDADDPVTDTPPPGVASELDPPSTPTPTAEPTTTPTGPPTTDPTQTETPPASQAPEAPEGQRGSRTLESGSADDTDLSLPGVDGDDAQLTTFTTMGAPGTDTVFGATPMSARFSTASVDVDTESVETPPANPVASIVSGVLAFIGLGPSLTGGPAGPTPPPPTIWAALAWVTRELNRATAGRSSEGEAGQTTSQDIGPAINARTAASSTGIFSVIGSVLRAPSNQAPKASPTFGNPDLANGGAVIGNLHATHGNGDPLTYEIRNNPAKGSVTLSDTGAFTYTPSDAGRHAASATRGDDVDKFVVTIRDGRGGVTNVTVRNLPVAPKNAAPVNGRTTTPQTNATTGAVTGKVLADDSESDRLTYSGTATTSNGRVVVRSDGSYTYTPTAAARHAASATAVGDSFNVLASDGHGGTLSVPVSVAVTPANKAPTGGKATVG
ncbi:MAG: hypothetical protein QOD39_4346, partial [Mycobacterium sp.]|nr:hypothetical protein [Mycobacterium sp.]